MREKYEIFPARKNVKKLLLERNIKCVEANRE